MPTLIRAQVTPEMLSWARDRLHLTIEAVALKTKYSAPTLQSWESGASRPTIGQARRIAKIYQIPFAAFYLPAPPEYPIHLPHDYRRIAGTTMDIGAEIITLVQDAWQQRDIALELFGLLNSPPRTLRRSLDIHRTPEESGQQLRQAIGITQLTQREWHNTRVAFNAWRSSVEELGVLVFQDSSIELEQIRGFSLDIRPYPVVMINRNDGYASRSFTLLHELAHIFLRNEGLCDFFTSPHQSPDEQHLEVYCNAVAAACLIPATDLLRHPLLNIPRRLNQWTDLEISELAKFFSVSRETLVRRLLTLERTSQQFYEQKRNQYIQEVRNRQRTPGFAPPAIDTLSRLGRPFVTLVLGAYNSKVVTSSDASDFLGLRGKHFNKLAELVGIG
jgi:Zn-dependent peptidase ImmA (M78 family)/transcriptional regulator with XRE-family HTH domain